MAAAGYATDPTYANKLIAVLRGRRMPKYTVALLLSAWFGVRHYGAEKYQEGQVVAFAEGKKARDVAGVAALAIESGHRTRLLEQDTTALRKEQNMQRPWKLLNAARALVMSACAASQG